MEVNKTIHFRLEIIEFLYIYINIKFVDRYSFFIYQLFFFFELYSEFSSPVYLFWNLMGVICAIYRTILCKYRWQSRKRSTINKILFPLSILIQTVEIEKQRDPKLNNCLVDILNVQRSNSIGLHYRKLLAIGKTCIHKHISYPSFSMIFIWMIS